MRTLTLRDGCFFGKHSATLGGDREHDEPEKIHWQRVDAPPADVYTDICIPDAPAGANAVAWLIEPPTMPGKDGHYRWVEEHRDAFRFALTYRADLLTDRFYRFYPLGGAWVKTPQHIPRKTDLVSIIVSEKRLSLGHRLRHEAVEAFGRDLDVFGRGYRPIQSKVSALLPHAFSVVIENGKLAHYFSEKLIDCLLMGTVPIYWGCPTIDRFFDVRGMVEWDELEQLGGILGELSMKRYRAMLPYIQANFHAAQEYACAEDWIAEAYPDLLEGAK